MKCKSCGKELEDFKNEFTGKKKSGVCFNRECKKWSQLPRGQMRKAAK